MSNDEFGLNLEEPVKKETKKPAARKMYTIFVDEEEDQPNFIKVSVNGNAFRIQRGVDVTIPEEYVEVLRNAVAYRLVQTTDPVTGLVNTREQNFNRVPWRIVG